jgi:uncharacterized protein
VGEAPVTHEALPESACAVRTNRSVTLCARLEHVRVVQDHERTLGCSPRGGPQWALGKTAGDRLTSIRHRLISPAITPRYAGWVHIRGERRAAGLSRSQLVRTAGVPQPNLSAYENGRQVPSPEVLKRIRRALAVRPSARVEQHRESIRALVAKHHAAAPRLFGSVARGEDEPGSDVDLLVDFTDEASLLDEIGLRLALADLLRVEVDVVAADSLRGRVRERVLREAVEV